jgi:hypothetical protein
VERGEVSNPKVARPVPFSSSHQRTSESPDLLVGSGRRGQQQMERPHCIGHNTAKHGTRRIVRFPIARLTDPERAPPMSRGIELNCASLCIVRPLKLSSAISQPIILVHPSRKSALVHQPPPRRRRRRRRRHPAMFPGGNQRRVVFRWHETAPPSPPPIAGGGGGGGRQRGSPRECPAYELSYYLELDTRRLTYLCPSRRQASKFSWMAARGKLPSIGSVYWSRSVAAKFEVTAYRIRY